MPKKAATPKKPAPKKGDWVFKRKPRKSKLTPAVAGRIIRALEAHNFLEVAARIGGVHPNTLANWVAWGTDKTDAEGKVTTKAKEPFRSFREDLEEAMAKSEQGLVSAIAASGWKGKMEILTRRHQSRWGRVNKVQLTGANEGPIRTEGPPPIVNITVSGDGGEASPFIFAPGAAPAAAA